MNKKHNKQTKVKIFVSYKRHEGKTPTLVEKFITFVANTPTFEVLWDAMLHTNAQQQQSELLRLIKSCNVFCLLLADNTAMSDWVQREVDFASAADKPIISVLLQSPELIDMYSVEQRLGIDRNSSKLLFDGSVNSFDTFTKAIDQAVQKSRKIKLSRTLSLPDYSQFHEYDGSPISKINDAFGNPSDDDHFGCDIFTIMPFREPFNTIYEDHIKAVARNLNLDIKRGDDFFSAGSIMSEVWSAIFRAYIVIAECTGRNPNVFYELGIAHTLNKPCILITQSIDDIPFDIRHLRHIKYEHTPRGAQELEQKLEKALSVLLFDED